MSDSKSIHPIDPIAIAEGIQDDPIDPSLLAAAKERVSERLRADASAPRLEHLRHPEAVSSPASPDTIEGCADFARLIPAFVAGELTPARRLLVEDHTRNCVPCRRVLMAARSHGLTAPAGAAHPADAPRAAAVASRFPLFGLAAAAAVLLTVSAGIWLTMRERPATGELARVQGVSGLVLLPDGQTIRPAASGTVLLASNILRTGRGSRAVVMLSDGSRVEMAERSELSVSGRRDGLTVRLGRGQVIVEAAKQKDGRHLAIATSDCDVRVVGTVFSVTHGTRGSRVSVLEGEVKVSSGSKTEALHPGDQTSTMSGADAVSIRSEVAWSERQAQYLALLGEIESIGRELHRVLPARDVRHGTRLLDVAPAGTVAYAAIPNAAGDLLTSYRLILAKVDQGGVLAQHIGTALSSAETRAQVEEALSLLGELGEQLGDEIALAMPLDATHTAGPLLYSEARRPRDLADFLPAFVARVNGAAKRTVVRLASDLAGAQDWTGIVIAQEGDFVALSPSAATLDTFRGAVAGGAGTSIAGSPFHTRLAGAYRDGVYQLFAADFGSIVAHQVEAESGADALKRGVYERLGLLDADSLVVTRNVSGETSTGRAVLGFGHERRGVAAWLAEPAPMGSLDFISANASLAAAVVVKEPSVMVGELFEIFRTGVAEFDVKLASFEQELGVDIRRDLAASLGGELALAVDGPLLPKPALEVIAEVYDTERLQAALRQLAAHADTRLRQEGKPGVTLTSTVVSGRTFHALALEGADPWLFWTYEDGYLVAAADRILVERALAMRASGASLRTSAEFVSRLPGDGPLDVSALVWQNLGAVLKTSTPPSLGYAWGGKDRVVFSATGEAGGLMGLQLPALIGITSHNSAGPSLAAPHPRNNESAPSSAAPHRRKPDA